MLREISHPSNQELLMVLDGELAPAQATVVQEHLSSCWACRARSLELEGAIAEYVAAERSSASALPSAAGARAQLSARMQHLASKTPCTALLWSRVFGSFRGIGWRTVVAAASTAAAIAAAVALLGPFPGAAERPVDVPNPLLTPGATVLVSQRQLCSEPLDKNKEVSAGLRKRVFSEYGIAGATPRAYEVDYLITPALGGADDIHNLWPHSHRNTRWNSRVKDALEDRLRSLVCNGAVELPTAQRELATNWIEAYKKYFGTDRPFGEQ